MTEKYRKESLPANNEEGFVLVVALVFLVLLSLLGVSTLSMTEIESQIASNDRQEKQLFYGIESGCRRGGQWLYNLKLQQADLYADIDEKDDYIDDGIFDIGMTIRSVDPNDEANLGDATYPVKYTYVISEQNDDSSGKKMNCKPIPGNNPNILKCYYQIDCAPDNDSDDKRDIALRVGKPTQF